MYGECDYCHDFKPLRKSGDFCKECREEAKRIVDKYFDGDWYAPLRYAANWMKEKQKCH